ncbi:membrane-spanning 4-domains subfamily A member 8-like [Hydractinia symbiolongicarpus]|uniref:membrane-spanning 4-domains subfamily A member 8-like n=1 Tax=Hydractinia symbiolongicarpus TaxID=13093 RepID=UPI00254D2690|nr:membrane-spanning 4-domains subfamily A member 8-like [Hydractinia symbiolongicarpus]
MNQYKIYKVNFNMASYSYPNQTGMHNTTVVTSMPAPAAPMIIPAAPRTTMNVSAIRGLGITQIVIGFLTLALGIGATAGFRKNYWLTDSGAGIWGGLWVLVTGIIGVCSASKPASGGLNGTHMAFCIISTVVAFIDGIIFAVGLGIYNTCYGYYGYYRFDDYYYYRSDRWACAHHRSSGIGVYASLVTLMAAEFFVALVAAIYCCQATGGCCGGPVSQGVIINQQPQYLVTSSTGQTMMTSSGYPVSSGVMAPPQYGYPQQQMVMQPGYPQQQMQVGAQANTSVAYSSQYPPQDTQKVAPPPPYQQ